MKRASVFLFVIIVILTSCQRSETTFESDDLRISIDEKGNLTSFFSKELQKEYIADNQESALLSIRVKGDIIPPNTSSYSTDEESIFLSYPQDGIKAQMKVEQKKHSINFELVSIENFDEIELIVWGPYPTLINKLIGETVGVVRGEEFALGLQALNPKTLGGYPWDENDCMPQLDIFENEDLTDLSEEGKRHVLYRVEAAKPTDFGSTLQAYCRNRNKDRVIENWGHNAYPAPVFEDGGILGSKIALFGCPVDKTLETIGKIEIEENLPHPVLNGEWAKKSIEASSAYIIMPFGEHDIQAAIDITLQAGLKFLYHPGPFKTWGHFELVDQFPNGIQGLKSCVDLAEEQGIYMGLHTLSNFITTNDPYVTPIPDDRLAKAGYSVLLKSIDSKQLEIPVEAIDVFRNLTNNSLKTVQIGQELIQYASVSDTIPWKLINCRRGAFNTNISEHKKGDQISLLSDHGYKVFLSNADLSIEMAENLASLYNQTGLRQISFDGLEGNRSTAMGNYGEILFTNTWYENLDDEIKAHYIADASRTSHYFWHTYTRMNWGEPWYAGFRESQTEYRLKNQEYFNRNMMPGMLGWFSLREFTSLEDIEWMLARSAGFDAGYAFVLSQRVLSINGQSKEILKQVKNWEYARQNGAFTAAQKEKMKDPGNEFHLAPNGENAWHLFSIHVSLNNKHQNKIRQPGEPVHSIYEYTNPYEEQSLSYTIRLNSEVKNLGIKKMYLELDNTQTVQIPVSLRNGEILKVTEGTKAVLYDKHWHIIKEFVVPEIKLGTGNHTILFDGSFSGTERGEVSLEFRCQGTAEEVTVKK